MAVSSPFHRPLTHLSLIHSFTYSLVHSLRKTTEGASVPVSSVDAPFLAANQNILSTLTFGATAAQEVAWVGH